MPTHHNYNLEGLNKSRETLSRQMLAACACTYVDGCGPLGTNVQGLAMQTMSVPRGRSRVSRLGFTFSPATSSHCNTFPILDRMYSTTFSTLDCKYSTQIDRAPGARCHTGRAVWWNVWLYIFHRIYRIGHMALSRSH